MIPLKVGIHAMVPWMTGRDAGWMTNSDTATMRAIRQDTYGSPEVLKEVELPRPEPGLSGT